MQQQQTSPTAARLAWGFAAGFLAVPTFHQIALLLLHLAGIAPAPWSMAPVPPLGVPAVLSASFWGGVWGIVLALVAPRFGRSVGYWLGCIVFGAVALTLVAWFVVGPLKGAAPISQRLTWPGIVIGPVVNGAWGLGVALFLSLLPGHRRAQAAASPPASAVR